MEYDYLIVGGGPAGLSTAIRLKQLQEKTGKEISVCLIEKGSEIGSHILSGNCFQPKALDELIPDWRTLENRPPLETQVTEDRFSILRENDKSFDIPSFLIPKELHNKGNYIISLGDLCKWLGQYAENLGVEIFPSTSASKIIYDQNQTVIGIQTGEMGISKTGEKKDTYTPGINILAKQTILAEGARGSLSETVIEKFNLRNKSDPQIYGIGLKEIWEVPEKQLVPGLVKHTVGWPIDNSTYGGSFMYHMKPNLIHFGYVIGLQYTNPYLNPYEEFQRVKTHRVIKKHLQGGKCISYGARVMNAGGYFSIPKLSFPGGLLVGCSAGFVNVLKIKGAHNAMKSGILAAESIIEHEQKKSTLTEITEYEKNLRSSWINEELYRSRNTKGAFKWGLYGGLAYNGLIEYITKGKEPWDLRNTKKDSEHFQRKETSKPIEYPKHDGVLTFDLLENLQKSGTYHDDDQPSHLKIKENKQSIPLTSLEKYAGPEERFCPAKVYEFVQDEKGESRLQINAQNCLHCKTCSIKMVDEYINWTVPEGSGGPNYSGM